jgi:transcription elongation factor Elf1
MVLVDQLYGYSHINETWECTKCGQLSYVNYPNPCNHVGQLREDYIMVCVNCGLAMGYYPPEETTP